MTGFTIAWLVIGGAGLIGAVAFYKWLALANNGWVRALLVAAALAFFLTPAPVPGYEGQLAPAFIVMTFEALFQADGAPAISIRILALSLGAVITLTVLGRFLLLKYLPSRD